LHAAKGEADVHGVVVEVPLHTRLSEYQWDRCWWNARWWARNEDPIAYVLFRFAGRGCPIELDQTGAARLVLPADYSARVMAALQSTQRPTGGSDSFREQPVSIAAQSERAGSTERRREVMEQRVADGDLRLRAIRFIQNGRVFYAAVAPADAIIQRAKVDVWSADVPEDQAGYQRAPMASRLREMANFIQEPDAILPLGGLLNARTDREGAYGSVLEFEPDDGGDGPIQSGWLTIPARAVPLYIVDMQHRLYGIERAIYEDGREDLKEFPVVLTIADGLSKLEEMEQFEIINTTQKKVRTDLARRLMSMQLIDPDVALKLDQRGKKWEARGAKVADWLNHNSEIWRGRILPPNKSKREMPTALARETSFVTSLKPILQTPVFQRMDDDQVATLVDRYWHAVREIWPDAFARPDDHLIHRTSGIFSLHLLMPEVFELARADGRSPTVERMVEVMKDWKKLGEDFWARDNEEGAARYGTSMGAFTRLAAYLRRSLPNLEFAL
jgi:DGQHR domain-containing protein